MIYQALALKLKTGGIKEYIRHHDQIPSKWPKLQSALKESGILSIRTFLIDTFRRHVNGKILKSDQNDEIGPQIHDHLRSILAKFTFTFTCRNGTRNLAHLKASIELINVHALMLLQ